jgi:hypothetical protein
MNDDGVALMLLSGAKPSLLDWTVHGRCKCQVFRHLWRDMKPEAFLFATDGGLRL